MKVWLVTVGEPLPLSAEGEPRLLRTGALAKHLTAAGHEVLWWTSAFDHYEKRHCVQEDRDVSWEGGTIRLLKSVGYRRNLSPTRFLEHAAVASKFRVQARTRPLPDIILVSLPTIELAAAAVGVGAAAKVPVLVDVRDLWPDALVDLLPGSLRPVGRMALAFLYRDARAALSRCTGIIGISPDYLDWALRMAGRARGPADAILPLGYAAPSATPQRLAEAEQRLAEQGVDDSRMICWYIGSFGRQYDLAPILDSARKLHAEGNDDVQFVISGAGELGGRWRRMADGLPNVIFTGWIGSAEINWMREHAAVGLQPYADAAPQGLANKLFEYLSAGIPVLSSLRGENERLVAETRCGLSYVPGDARDFLRKLRSLLANEQERREMGRRGQELFLREFDSQTIFGGLTHHLSRLVEESSVVRGV